MRRRGKKLAIFAHDTPVPANHGGRVDMHKRLLELSRRGFQIYLTSWDSLSEKDARLAGQELQRICAGFQRFRVSNASRLHAIRRTHLPFGVATHHLDRSVLEQLAKNALQQDVCAVVLDGIYGAPAALAIARLAVLPLVYRSHNIEWRHMLDQARSEQFLIKKLRYLADSVRMKRLEQKVRSSAAAILEICEEDLGLQPNFGSAIRLVMRPIVNSRRTSNGTDSSSRDAPDTDILFAGNLHNANNIEGLRWFANDVLPRVTKTARVVFAGSHPNRYARHIAQTSGATLLANPASMDAVRAVAKVLVNPVLRSSGVNLKTVDMLASGMPVVCTSAALRGIPSTLRKWATVADNPEDFAKAINAKLSEPHGYTEAQAQAAHRAFGPDQVDRLEEALETI